MPLTRVWFHSGAHRHDRIWCDATLSAPARRASNCASEKSSATRSLITRRATVPLIDAPCGEVPSRRRATRGTRSPVRSSISMRNTRSAGSISNVSVTTRTRMSDSDVAFRSVPPMSDSAARIRCTSRARPGSGGAAAIRVFSSAGAGAGDSGSGSDACGICWC